MPTPFQYDNLEDEVVTRLTTAIGTVAEAKPLPESEAKIKEAFDGAIDNNKTLALVAYTGSDFGPSTALNIVKQEESMNLLVNLQSNLLRGEKGIYNVIRLVKDSLLGFQSQSGGRLKLKSIDFDSRDEKVGLFSYNIVFTVTKVQAQKHVDGEDDITGAANLSQTTFTDAN